MKIFINLDFFLEIFKIEGILHPKPIRIIWHSIRLSYIDQPSDVYTNRKYSIIDLNITFYTNKNVKTN